jgi:hypothetical protein
MSSFKIAIILENDFTITDFNPEKINDDYIYENIIDFVKIVEINSTDQMMETIINTLELTPNVVGNTSNINEAHDHIIQMCHTIDDQSFTSTKPYNQIANCLLNGPSNDGNNNGSLKGSVVCMKSEIMADGTYNIASITINDICNIYRKKCVKRGILIEPDNENCFHFMIDATEWLTQTEKNNYKYFEFRLLENIVRIYVELEPSIDKINTPLSSIFGKHHVKGIGLLTLLDQEGKYLDIDLELYNKLVAILSDKSVSRTITVDEDYHDNIINGIKVNNNFYRILNTRYNKFIKQYNCKYIIENTGQNDRKYLHELMQDNIKNLNKV